MADELILKLDFETTPSSEDLGEVFSALGRDYRDMTGGRTLVLVRVDSGSIIATLTDATLAALPYAVTGIAVVTAVNALAEFFGNLKKWLGYAKSDTRKGRLYRKGKKSPGQRSVEAIVKIAVTTRSHVRVTYKSEKGETLEAELTPAEAINARKEFPPQQIGKAPRGTTQLVLSSPEVRSAFERLQEIGMQNLSPAEVRSFVAVIVAVLQAAGASHLVSEMASELENHGYHSVASAMRQHIGASNDTDEAPPST